MENKYIYPNILIKMKYNKIFAIDTLNIKYPINQFILFLWHPIERAHVIEAQDRSEKYVSIRSDSQAALKTLQAAKTTSPSVRECHQALNDISVRHAVGLYWVPDHAEVRRNDTADRLARSGSGQGFIGPEPFLGVSRQNIRQILKRWMKNQHLTLWRGPSSTQKQARELISGPNLATGTRLLSFNRTQTRVVIGLLTGHNTLRRHLHGTQK
jgi:hypothetical protein